MLVMSSSDSGVLLKMATFTFEEQRVIIRFLHLCGMKPIEIHQQLSETCNDGVMSVKNVRSWIQQFKVVVVEKLVNTSRPMRSIVVMKGHSCSLFGPFFAQCWKKLRS